MPVLATLAPGQRVVSLGSAPGGVTGSLPTLMPLPRASGRTSAELEVAAFIAKTNGIPIEFIPDVLELEQHGHFGRAAGVSSTGPSTAGLPARSAMSASTPATTAGEKRKREPSNSPIVISSDSDD